MAPQLEIPDNAILVLTMVYTSIAIVVTTFRLTVRKFERWWWDDIFALVCVLAIMLQCIVLWMRINRVQVLKDNLTASIAFFYLNSMCLYLEDWTARLSILYSIIRIAPSDRTKMRLRIVGVFFFLAMVANGSLLVATCEKLDHENHWHTVRYPPRCKLKESVPIYRIVTGIAADAILVITPIRILQGLKSAPKLKKRLIIIFLASLLMTITCIAQSTITITLPGDPELIASLTEGFTALITCNLTIVVTAVFRLATGKNAMEADIGRTGFTSPPSAIAFRTFSRKSRTTRSMNATGTSGAAGTQPDSGYSNVLTTNGTTGTGLTSDYNTDDERKSDKSKSDEESGGEVYDIRATQSFMERWRALDVDKL